MNRFEGFIHLVKAVAADTRLTASHVALIFALSRFQVLDTVEQPYNVSRAELMKSSHIKSRTTYHKILFDLQRLGYIQYYPSFHPGKRSRIILNSEISIDSYREAA